MAEKQKVPLGQRETGRPPLICHCHSHSHQETNPCIQSLEDLLHVSRYTSHCFSLVVMCCTAVEQQLQYTPALGQLQVFPTTDHSCRLVQ